MASVGPSDMNDRHDSEQHSNITKAGNKEGFLM